MGRMGREASVCCDQLEAFATKEKLSRVETNWKRAVLVTFARWDQWEESSFCEFRVLGLMGREKLL
jgi:hypothetical protein